MRPRLEAVAIALTVCAGYYFGSILGLLLRLPPATPSIIWPPNAILTAALLLVPPRRWWLVLLPVLPVHIAVQLPTGWPLTLVLSLFLTNCTEAIVSAGTVWALSDAPPQLRYAAAPVDVLRSGRGGHGHFRLSRCGRGLVVHERAVLDGLAPAVLQQHPCATDDRSRSRGGGPRLAAVDPDPVVEADWRGRSGWRRPDCDGLCGLRRRAVRAPAASRRVQPGAAGLAASISPMGCGPVWHAWSRRHAVHCNDSCRVVGRPRPRPVRSQLADDDGAGPDAVVDSRGRDGTDARGARRRSTQDPERARRAARFRGTAGASLRRLRSGTERPHGRRL